VVGGGDEIEPGRAGSGKVVCVVSGGNIDAAKLARILVGESKSAWQTVLREGQAPAPYLHTRFNELQARFSPQPSPRWVAYASDESGRLEIYIDAFPEPRGKKRISTSGGQYPKWAADGRELFYVSPENKLMAVSFERGSGTLEPSTPRELFTLPMRSSNAGAMFEPSRDGKRFLVLTSPEAAQQSLNVIVNWPALLKKGGTPP